MMINGGYDSGYLKCPCFWGKAPGSLVLQLDKIIDYSSTLSVLDMGCGEGKNAIYYARKGATVSAIDISEAGLNNAKNSWPDYKTVNWLCGDIRKVTLQERFNIVISYGLFHCFENAEDISIGIKKMQSATKRGGYNILCAFNDRHQDLSAHPGFFPTLISHSVYEAAYSEWEIIYVSDQDLYETHPHNNIPHSHSLTRLIARKISE